MTLSKGLLPTTHTLPFPTLPPPLPPPPLQLRASSLELALLSRSSSTRSLSGAPGSPSYLHHSHSLPPRSASTRCLSGAGAAGSAATSAVAISQPRDLHSAHSLPSCLCPMGATTTSPGASGSQLAASCSQLELVQSPQDALFGCSIVRVRLGSSALPADCAAPAAAHAITGAAPHAHAGVPRSRSLGASCSWKPSQALAAAAASTAARGGGAGAAPLALRQADAQPGRHQGLEELTQRRAALEQALGSGWSTAVPVGLPLVAEAEEPHESSPTGPSRTSSAPASVH